MEESVHQKSEVRCIQMIRAAVLGSPINHSLSPLLHSYAYKYLDLDATYSACEVKSGELAAFLEAPGKNFEGLSLTMPLKEEAILLASQVSQEAAQVSSANTLFKIDGLWHATTTDVEGFEHSFEFNHLKQMQTVMILGSGATARAAAAACDVHGRQIYIVGRSTHRHEAMRLAAPRSNLTFLPWDKTELINTADLIINTSPANAAEFFLDSIFKPEGTLFEVIYHPWPTRLAAQWSENSPVVDGLELLIHQGISQMEIFSGQIIDRHLLAPLLRVQALKAIS